MPLPDFTNEEQYAIHCIKARNASRISHSPMWGYLAGGAAVAGFGAYCDNTPMLLLAFALICGFRIHEERYQLKWIPVWRSIIEKYEAGCVGEPDDPPAA